jgi:hypothetical protein
MVAIGRSSHAFFFDGVSDSVIIPQGRFTKTGVKDSSGTKVMTKTLQGVGDSATINDKAAGDFVIEAWVVPDCGGVIAHREGQFTLEMGTVDTPGPAVFSVNVESIAGPSYFRLATAYDASTRWDGIVYPQQEHGGIHDSYNRYDKSNYGDATNLNFNNRPLYHVVAGIQKNRVFLAVNGEIVSQQDIPPETRLARSTEHVYLGGKGGEFRGAIEAIHFSNEFDENMLQPSMAIKGNTTSALFRFEEPIDIVEGTYEFSAFTAASDGTTKTLTMTAADAQTLIARLTGKAYDATSPTTTFTSTPYSMGNYKVVDYYTNSGTAATLSVAHTPYNLLINPGAINRNTQKPNQSPPERVRLESINGNTGVVTFNSIHVDFINGTSGLRGALHSRTANVDNYFVVIGADLLIDNGTGKPYQPPHYGTQIFDKTGQMVLDEGNASNHGLVYSSQMATDTTNNPYAVTWPATLDTLFQVGHSGRHTFSHIIGHEYMRRYPKPSELIIDQQADGSADIVQMAYDSNTRDIDEMFPMNSLLDFYSETLEAPIARIENSSSVATIVNNGMPASKKELIAIGGSGFKYAPFMLKGPVPEAGDIDENNRLFHLTPESESRVALLHVPALRTSHDLAPYVEVHYNAIDLTGASMGQSTPMLMVTKTVPAGSHILTGTTRVLDVITSDLANTTLYSPGGVIYLSNAISGYGSLMQESHTLIGDNTGGQDSDTELDLSRTPALYTPPNDVNAEPAGPPKAVARSHNGGTHESVYHRLAIEAMSSSQSDTITDEGAGKRTRQPTTDKSGTGVFDLGPTTHSSRVFEMFNIIDNVLITDEAGIMAKIFVQPSVKSRVNQLSLVRSLGAGDSPNIASIMFLMSRCRVRGVSKQESPETNMTTVVITASGIADSFVNENVSAVGSGSPDSHVVKEIEPNAPVVTVTLGGPGQGGVNTKPTFDPSPLMRLPGSTRRSCATQARIVTTTGAFSMSVTPLNNDSPDLKSWGTICFPQVGRIFLEDGASAAYTEKTGAGFYFSESNAVASRTFLDGAGTAYATFHEWCNATGIISQGSAGTYLTSVYIFNDGDFDNDSLTQDGSTVNDRLFQSLDDVTHDYQLGTQYASTRAMVEIPIFPQQFFDHTDLGIFPGPDNSMKVHVDATYTAHTWNPTPVGRRANDVATADKSAKSAYSYTINNQNYIESATILRIEDATASHKHTSTGTGTGGTTYTNHFHIFVSHPNMFPDATNSSDATPTIVAADDVGNLKGINRLRRVFLTSGEWAVYDNNPALDGFLSIPINATGGYFDGYSETFFQNAIVGAKIHTGGGFRNETLMPIDSDAELPSSDLEGRSPFYYDAANMKTQGGNLDYGLRQYVSAVEFKAGPLANPHAPRTISKRAKSTIMQVQEISGNATDGFQFNIILDDASLFPDVPYSRDSNNNSIAEQGDLTYIAEIGTDTPLEVYYLGKLDSIAGANSVLVTTPKNVSLTVGDFVGAEFKLVKAGNAFQSIVNPANMQNQELQTATFHPSTSAEQWTFVGATSAGASTTLNITNGNNRFAHANTIGTNIRTGDLLFLEDSSNVIKYVGEVADVKSNLTSGAHTVVTLVAANAVAVANGDDVRIGVGTVVQNDADAILNRSWVYPFAQGGLRDGDTVWMNMTINNPHAVEGLFAKSRGVMNEAFVWSGFNGGEGALANRPRDSIPLENFLIGNSCLETAQNFAQHVNKTVEMNYEAMGLDATQAPTVAYIDPYLSTDGNARVLLFDVGHDREFIAFHDLHMQVQSSADTPTIGFTRNIAYEGGTIKLDKHLISVNGGAPHYFTTQIDVANGFPSENKYVRSTQQSKFIESAYAHNVPNTASQDLVDGTPGSDTKYTLQDPSSLGNNPLLRGKGHGHFVHTGLYHEETGNTHTVGDSVLPRVQPAVASVYYANEIHKLIRKAKEGDLLLRELKLHRATQNPATHSLKDASTLFDTPDGTRVISAFLCLKGKRNTTLELASHEESRLQHLKHWTQMDFVRRMTLDLGEVGVKEGVTDIEAAAREMVRLINQGGALNGRTHARRPSQQYPGESERLDLTRIGVRQDTADPNKDPTSAHINADFAATGSTYDPAPFWYGDIAFDSHDRGSHMGYVRAHMGRVVEDINGNEGYSIVIHSTIPGASGRNFCVWLDNSKGQSSYQPQFLIGHGGRFRNFWAQPDEILSENMHPAPMPLNKDGRPFAPVSTLREFVAQEEPDEAFTSNHDITPRRNETANPKGRNISAHLGGIAHNSVNDESFETQSPSTALVKGLRMGKQATGRINFGGLVASGVPGFSPIAGKHGLGRKGDDEFDKLYNEGLPKAGTSPTAITSYSGHVNTAEITDDAVGDTPLYGFRFNDHRGQGYGVRFIYRKMDEAFANDLTTIPSTLDDEICVYFNDGDVAKGGFTIGQHMLGFGDATGRLDVTTVTMNSWRGNQWRGVYAPSAGIDCAISWDASATTLTVQLGAPFDSGQELGNHPDILGYLGFPRQNGVIQITDPMTGTTDKGTVGNVISYESRTQLNSAGDSGVHTFYGVRGSEFTASHSLTGLTATSLTNTAVSMFNASTDRIIKALISPRINWTTLMTDELMAAVTAEAINMADPNTPEGIPFDCRHMYAVDGRTFGEWGVAADAIRIRAHNPQRGARPLSTMFEASLHRDLGIEAPHLEFGEYEKLDQSSNSQWTVTAPAAFNKPVSDADIEDNHRKVDCGYLPHTVLQIRTKARGYHTNTPTPILVDSYNDPVPTKTWANNLKGLTYTSRSGDHILPALDNALVTTDFTHSDDVFTTNSGETTTHILVPAGEEAATFDSLTKLVSFGDAKVIWSGSNRFATVTSVQGANSATKLKVVAINYNEEWNTLYGASADRADVLLMLHADKDFSGYRLYGSIESEPVTYFKNGRDSNDHSVPLYFGGGFSGVVLDVNDGSQNDYSSFYTHPYSNGPTGTAGIQNANEISTAYALMDCNALLAFFPGTPYLNQHRGSINPPAYNQNNVLSADIDSGTLPNLASGQPSHVTARYTAGIVRQRPIPLIMRMPHQTARYTDHKTATPYFTTYLIYGPGQAFPFNETASNLGVVEPHPGYVVTTGNSWSKVPHSKNLPNEITNNDNDYGPPDANYQSRRNRFHWQTTLNWSPAQGTPNIGDTGASGYGLKQRPEHGYHYGEHFMNPVSGRVVANNEADYKKAHPYQHCAMAYYGIAMSADMTFHMDGGYHPGGSWMDNQMAFNPPMEKDDLQISKLFANAVQPTAYRVSGVIAKSVLAGSLGETATDFDREIIVVDGTRCQNGEELATIIGQAINENPGKGALKAMGGTFMPSMSNAQRQDRYGWIEMDYGDPSNSYQNATTGGSSQSYIEGSIAGSTRDVLEQIPACGWIRTDTGGRSHPSTAPNNSCPAFAPYHSREIYEKAGVLTVRFWLAPNKITGKAQFEDMTTWHNRCESAGITVPDFDLTAVPPNLPTKLYVWSKSGVHYHNNAYDTPRDHMTRSHFSGLVDAIDRTRPVGAMGWSGERYSYLNSLKVTTSSFTDATCDYNNATTITMDSTALLKKNMLVSGTGIPAGAFVVSITNATTFELSASTTGGAVTNGTLTFTTNLYGAGLGAWHAKLGFSPYGPASSVMSTYSHLPHYAPMRNSPEASGPISGTDNDETMLTTPYSWTYASTNTNPAYNTDKTDAEHSDYFANPVHIGDADAVPRALHHPQGVFGRAFLVISYEGELGLVAKRDRDGVTAMGDWLAVVNKTAGGVAAATAITFAGTAQWDERIHSVDRFVAPAHGGPNIEALVTNLSLPADDIPADPFLFNAPLAADIELFNAEPCYAKTGDLFFDLDESPGSFFLEDATSVERNLITDLKTSTSAELDRYGDDANYWLGDTNAFKMNQRSPAKNFSVEHVVWKRMDGGNLSLPAVNARGLGAVPFVTRVLSNTPHTMGEKLYGINRFSFETTNSAMFPIIQAQELAHPQIAAAHPDELRNVLAIPNEELQFEEMQVEDDTGQIHIIEGGSPFGTIIRTFNAVSDRSAEGFAPATAGSGVEPNLKVRLPHPDSIPGNLLIRAGFDRLQAYQNESMGTGGMMRPMSSSSIKHLFTDDTKGPRLGGTFSDHNWEHISQGSFPDPTYAGWETATGNAPLETSYELHDRTLFFHITKNGNTHSHRHPTFYTHAGGVVNAELTAVSFSGTTLTVNTAPNASLFNESIRDGRKFLRLYDPTTDKGGVASFTGISSSTFTGCVGDADFAELVKSSITTLKVVPSYYIPAGSTRFFASRRLRDHAEVSGNSPDIVHSTYITGLTLNALLCHTVYSRPKMTPMALPRMGHHFVNPTMAMLPGHFAHPAYQGLYNKHRAIRSATVKPHETLLMEEQTMSNLKTDISTTLTNNLHGYDTLHTFGALTATPSGPSDIHGGAFTLMFESKIRSDGYGVLASEGQAGVINAAGGHTIVLEAAATYTLRHHFPDPSEVGAYQIVIQPNIHKSQLMGYHANGGATALPDGSVNELTSQQVALVIGLREPDSATGAVGLVLAEATMADVRGCEVFVNELILDHDPDHGSQFTNIPPLMLYNALGVQATESPAFVKRSLPYQPQMFDNATPGMTTNIPWWSIVHKDGPDHADATGFRHLNHHRLDNYYEFLRASTGSIACQITLAGYPSIYPDIYHEVLENISLNPVCTVVSVDSTTQITVDDARGFPQKPYYGNKLEYTDVNGVRRTHTYTERSGYDSSNMNKPKQFTITAKSSFTSNLTAGTKLRLTRAYDFRPAGAIFTDSKTSMVTRILPQMLQGSRDTNSLHVADAFLCLWHPNLGRPHTFYSDSSRTWLNPLTDRAVAQKPLNSMPEHFETVHYHDAAYYASLGPFAFDRKTPAPPYEIIAHASVGTNVPSTVVSVDIPNKLITTTRRTAKLVGGTKIMIDGIAYTVQDDGGSVFDNHVLGVMPVIEPIVATIPIGSTIMAHAIGSMLTADVLDTTFGSPIIAGNFDPQGGQADASDAATKTNLNHYWPCGSRGGPLISRLDGYGYVSTSWDFPREYTFDGPVWADQDDDGSYVVTNGVVKSTYDAFTDATCDYNNDPTITMDSTAKLVVGMGVSGTGIPGSATVSSITNATTFELSASTTGGSVTNGTLTFTPVQTRTRPFGYRIGLRQPYNKPQWSLYGMRAFREAAVTGTNTSVGYPHGPLVQGETETWTYAGGSGLSNGTYPNTQLGIMERQTNFSGMLGVDKPEWQVRYSDGMRMARAFGCPVRTLRNASGVLRDWWGDGEGKGIYKLDEAVAYYLVDWWGNTRGEEVRRHPVRGFGIRPAWDAGDVYEYDRTGNKTPFDRIYNGGFPIMNTKALIDASGNISVTTGFTIPRFAGRLNNVNSNDATELVDVYFPTNAHRVGDDGHGRGLRYPTAFNEDVLTALDEPYHASGVVLSHHTAEPNMNDGYIRARNDVLQADEVPRGISARLDIAEDGLLKPEAVVSDRVETVSGDSPHKDAVSRSAPRIGLDTENVEGVDDNLIAINTEAHSLHSDRGVGQRVIVHGGMQAGSQTIGHYDLTALDFSGQPQGGAMRLSHTSNFNPLGGTYIAEARNFVSPIDDTEWGGIPTSGMALWLKADSLDLADGAAVTSWKDSGPHGFEFTQSTASKQPVYIASSSNVNNMPVVDCDGTDIMSTPFDARLNTTDVTLFVVAWSDDDDGNAQGVLETFANSPVTRAGHSLFIRWDSSDKWQWRGGADTTYTVVNSPSNAVVVNQAELVTGTIAGGDGAGSNANFELFLQGVSVGSSTGAWYVADEDPYGIGHVGSFELKGKIAEIIQYNRAMSTTERQQVEGYLAEKYGFTNNVSQWKSSNPYQTDTNGHQRTNLTDKRISYMLRPVRLLDKQHAEMFRSNLNLHSSSPQYGSNYFGATAGGKYGLYVYETTNGQASAGSYIRSTNPDTNPPYAPAYYMDISTSDTVPMSQGPKIIGTAATGFDSSLLDNEITRVVMSENTLQHYRADAARRRTHQEGESKEERMDYTVQPRFSQSLHPKGHKGDVSYNSNDHSGDAS